MPEEIAPNWFRMRIPLPDTPLKELNSYLITGNERNLLIDTGLNRPECLEAMQGELRELKVDLSKTDLFITHLHVDHLGLASRLTETGSRVYLNRFDADIVSNWAGFDPMLKYAQVCGFPAEQLRTALDRHPGFKFRSEQVPEMTPLTEDAVLTCAGYHLHCLHTPGHTPGHLCLYEPGRKVLVSGDHILGDITPNIQCWSNEQNPLKDYLASLDKLAGFEVELVLPGHRELLRDIRTRIRQLQKHHAQRLDEVLDCLTRNEATPYQVAAAMTWDLDCDSWDDFPVTQQWFATGEAVAHLRFLEERGLVQRIEKDNLFFFSLA
ncbi:MAG: MBL fold metallo-hydrolase [Thermodesulfobacteriota bacterium]